MLDETEFLSEYGIRAISKHHDPHPYVFNVNGADLSVRYLPAESDSGLFGGNSNWRGPDLVPCQLPVDRIAAEVSSLLRRRFQGRVPQPDRGISSPSMRRRARSPSA